MDFLSYICNIKLTFFCVSNVSSWVMPPGSTMYSPNNKEIPNIDDISN